MHLCHPTTKVSVNRYRAAVPIDTGVNDECEGVDCKTDHLDEIGGDIEFESRALEQGQETKALTECKCQGLEC